MSKFKEQMSQKNENSQDRYIPMKSSVDEVQIIENKNLVSAKIICYRKSTEVDKTNECKLAYFQLTIHWKLVQQGISKSLKNWKIVNNFLVSKEDSYQRFMLKKLYTF